MPANSQKSMKNPGNTEITGRILYLRRDDISTDEITPVAIMSHYDTRLGRFAYTGFKSGDTLPIKAGDVLAGGYSIVVAGQRYGKGSSREHSPAAEMHAGIRLVFAQSFERIYRQNADNIGLLTCTDFSLLAKLEAGQAITLDEVLASREGLAQSIVRSGGLLHFGQSHLRGLQPASTPDAKPQTLFEKIVSRHRLSATQTPEHPQVGDGIFVQADWRFIHEYYTGMAADMLRSKLGAGYALHDTNSILVFEDHSSYIEQSPAHLKNGLVPNMHAMRQAQRDFVALHGLKSHITLTDEEALQDDGSNIAGISHAMMAEHYALPGQLIVGTDSHTPHSGALGCVAYGVGTTDMANAFVTGAARLTLPAQLRL
jgi:3-isopropylmalate/(R)-2-methylmalate dehydratase large subunit